MTNTKSNANIVMTAEDTMKADLLRLQQKMGKHSSTGVKK
jgi:hypothetical protein